MNNVIAIIVLYKEALQQSRSYQTLAKAMQYANTPSMHLVVYDNSPQPQTLNANEAPFIIHYKSDVHNGGISRAYNYGAAYAKQLPNIQWLLFLDQDTNLPQNLFTQFNNSIQAHPNIYLFAPILMLENNVVFSPCRYLLKRGFPVKQITPGVHSLQKLSPVNSGMLVSLKAFFEVGGYKDEVRLDFSDFQFADRFRKKYSLFCVVDATGIQAFSNHETNIYKLNTRYALFCESAKHTERETWLDAALYFAVVFMRATTLSLRTRKLLFYKTFFQQYLKQ